VEHEAKHKELYESRWPVTDLVFPDSFFWGASTSPTQVEGQIVNEWASFTANDGTHPDQGGDHWQAFENDAAYLPEMNLNAFRMGLDWGRLQHGPYHDLDPQAVERYKQMLQFLTSRGITPMLTLFHFACPYWLAAKGGWLNPETPRLFADFVHKVLAAGIHADYWVTVNEPGVYVTMAYVLGLFPPQQRLSLLKARRALGGMIEGHLYAYRLIHARLPQAKVGIAKHVKRIVPNRRWHPVDSLNAAVIQNVFCDRILGDFTRYEGEKVADFLGMNFYGKLRIHGFKDISPISGDPRGVLQKIGALCDDMWEHDAGWLPECASALQQKWGLPIQVTECGFATDDEDLRCRLLLEHIQAIAEAIRRGVKIEGLFYWSLVDNFEWAEGMGKRFGLVGIDFNDPNRPRTLRPAAQLLSQIVGANALHPDKNTGDVAVAG